jgi:hypothetical protein
MKERDRKEKVASMISPVEVAVEKLGIRRRDNIPATDGFSFSE